MATRDELIRAIWNKSATRNLISELAAPDLHERLASAAHYPMPNRFERYTNHGDALSKAPNAQISGMAKAARPLRMQGA